METQKLVYVENCEGMVLHTFGRSNMDAAERAAREASLETTGVSVVEGGSGTYQIHGIVTVTSKDCGILSQFYKGKRL